MKRKQKKRKSVKKKRSPLVYFAIFFIISGILLLLYPIVGNLLANRERSAAVSEYDDSMKKLSEQEKQEELKKARAYNEGIFSRQQTGASVPVVYDSIMKYGSVMGTVDIPSIDIKAMPFYHGTSYATLDKGLGHFQPTSLPVGGVNTRSVITGHSGVQNQLLFSEIRDLEEGDIFFVNILGERLAYEIESFEEILPTEVDRVSIVPGKDLVTLLTCTPPGINTYRLLVTGHRIPYEEAMNKAVKKRNRWSYQNIVFLTLFISGAIFILLMGSYRYNNRRLHSKDKKIAHRARKRLKRLFILSKALFILLFLAMSVVIIFAGYGYFKMEENQDPLSIDIGQNLELADYNLEKIANGTYEDKKIASVSISEYAKAKNNLMDTVNQAGIGKVWIPQITLDTPILAGLSEANLLSGGATFRENQQLGKGNYVLLAHSIVEKDVLFHRIEYLNEGDLMYATDFSNIYVYTATLNKVIEDTEVEYIEEDRGTETPLLTLIRCEGGIGTRYRRVAQGKLTEVVPIEEADEKLLSELSLQQDKEVKEVTGDLIETSPLSSFEQFCIQLAAAILADPIQTAIPLFFLFLLPIILFYSI